MSLAHWQQGVSKTPSSYLACSRCANNLEDSELDLNDLMKRDHRTWLPAPDILENLSQSYELEASYCLEVLYSEVTRMHNRIEVILQASCVSATEFAAVVSSREEDRMVAKAQGGTYISSDYNDVDGVTVLCNGLLSVRNGCALMAQAGGDIFALAIAGVEHHVEDGGGRQRIG